MLSLFFVKILKNKNIYEYQKLIKLIFLLLINLVNNIGLIMPI